jgi:hypothetical protein
VGAVASSVSLTVITNPPVLCRKPDPTGDASPPSCRFALHGTQQCYVRALAAGIDTGTVHLGTGKESASP